VIGWWSQAPGTALTAGPAPAVPAGGLYVANGPTAPAAISAVRVATGGDANVRVTLALAPDATASTTNIAACPTTAQWAPTDGGSLDQAPAFDCTSGVALGTVDTTASTITWLLPTSFVRDGAVDVALVPAAGASPFSAPFEAPAAGAVDVSPTSDESASTAGSPSSADGSASSSTDAPSDAGAAGSLGTGTAFPSDVTSSAPAVGPSVATAAPASPAPSTATRPAGGASTGRAVRPIGVVPGVADRRGPRILAVALLLALAVACYRLAIMEPRPVRAIVTRRSAPPAEAPPAAGRGIGRYVRPREGRPRGV